MCLFMYIYLNESPSLRLELKISDVDKLCSSAALFPQTLYFDFVLLVCEGRP